MGNFQETGTPKPLRSKATEKARKIWDSLCYDFEKNKIPIEFNFKENVKDIFHNEYVISKAHYIHPYPGKIFPYIPAFLLSVPQLCPANGIILDPFSGSGTILLESIIHPLYKRDAYGVEINPLGRLISKVKTTPLLEEGIEKRAKSIIDKLRYNDLSFTNNCFFENISFWFSPRSIKRLSILAVHINDLKDDDYKDFFYLCFSSIIRKVSFADPFIPPPVKLNIGKYNKSPDKFKFLQEYSKIAQNANIKSLFKDAISQNKAKIISLNKVWNTHNSISTASIIWDDAKSIRRGELVIKGRLQKKNSRLLKSCSIDLIITSPPYLTAQKYIRTQKLEIQWLDMLSNEARCDLQEKIVGAERVSCKRFNNNASFGVSSIDTLISWLTLRSKERAAAIYCYFEDMKKALIEMHRVLKNRAFCIIVVGNNHVLGKYIETHKLLTDLAINVGFKLKVILKDMIRGRGMITKRHNSGGLIKEEYVIVLQKRF